ncbi:hypothetical protein [Pseudomonas benzenivorans]|uniref:Lipoprotein n=1 Tax=Pseudomonas benzenivorans TaxID=556533 RepID=A0ABY5HEC6_9PSED|nr:hypothetical protein [Pseudomonas benzenivorans]UTW09351.1 hypothetical protein KDW96_08645 [Pseudomonas benzenivorans]
MKRFAYLLVLALCAGVTGCTINHPIDKDYAAYLANNQGESALPKAQGPADYLLAPATETHHYEFRSALVGHANLWIVDFGKLLDMTLASQDVQQAFEGLKRHDGASSSAPVLRFELMQYRFEDFRAYVTLNVEVASAGQQLFSKTYQVEGKSQGGKMFWGGAFAMKNAVQQSTKLAMDEILRNFIRDFNQLKLAQN